MTRSEIRTEIRRLIGDTSSLRFSDTVLNDWIDLGNLDIVSQLDLDTAMATISTVASEPNYQLASQTVFIKEVYLQDQNSKETRLNVVDQDELVDLYGTQWRETAAGQPVIAYRADYNVLGLYPKPDSNNASKTLRFFYYKWPSDFASDSDTPIFMAPLHDAITTFCLARCWASLGDTQRQIANLKIYENQVRKFMSKTTKFSQDQEAWRW